MGARPGARRLLDDCQFEMGARYINGNIWYTEAMIFTAPLLHGKLIRRYKRFLADVELNDPVPAPTAQIPEGPQESENQDSNPNMVTAHCPNSGSMKGLLTPGNPVMISRSDNPRRKLKYTLELIKVGNNWVGVNTSRPNHIVHEAIVALNDKSHVWKDGELEGPVHGLAGYESIAMERKYGENSRIDILLEDPKLGRCYVEVKNVTMAEGDTAMFPDAVTARGTKHLRELTQMVAQGHRAVMFYLVQREDCRQFVPARHIDPLYATTLAEAHAAGVEALCYSCKVSPDGIWLAEPLPITIEP